MAQIEEKQTVEMTAEEKDQFEAFRKEKAKKEAEEAEKKQEEERKRLEEEQKKQEEESNRNQTSQRSSRR